MHRGWVVLVGALFVPAAGIGWFIAFSKVSEPVATTKPDPRTVPLLVKVANATSVPGIERAFTGTIAARVQSNLGFRVPGKIVERLVDVGQEVRTGQPLMRIDATDLQLVLTAKRNAVAAARAIVAQTRADEKRYAALMIGGLAATPQRYEQAKAALDTAEAQLAAADADAKVAENEAAYATLVADADGTIVAALGEPGQVIAAGQTIFQLAHAGPREALIALPETIRPVLGSTAEARVYGSNGPRVTALLRQISDAADAQTRTFEARYVLDGDAASAPLGATVTIAISNNAQLSDVAVPLGAVIDDGRRTGVWVFDEASASVRFNRVQLKRLGEETAVVTGIEVGKPVVALGAHLLKEGASVRTTAQTEAANR